jgi:hypothetical protein
MMNKETPEVLEYDDWTWHTEGMFPKDQPPEQAYVHIGVFVAWLLERDMLDAAWVARAGVKRAIDGIADRSETPCVLRDMTAGRLVGDMLSPEGQAFSSAYYAPEYGYNRDWRNAFGHKADHYAVPDAWETFDRIAPVIDRRYAAWVTGGRPVLMPMPGLIGAFFAFWRAKIVS